MATCEFALKQLKKHGWKEGSGLGKEKHGISEAIKVTLKMDKAGMGHDPAKEFTDHWWMRAFNDAARQTGVKNKEKKVEKERVTESKESARKKRFYAGFVKTSLLANGVEENHKNDTDSSDEEDKPVERIPTLDELHKYCDGATGHRASMALGGVKMSGKLARVAAADRLFELRMRGGKLDTQALSHTAESGDNLDTTKEPTKKKKKKKKSDKDSADEPHITDSESCDKSKKKSKCKDYEEVSIAVPEKYEEELGIKTLKKKKKKNKKHKDDSDQGIETENIEKIEQPDKNNYGEQKKKKKKKQETNMEELSGHGLDKPDCKDIDRLEVNNDDPQKSKKKKKRKQELEEVNENNEKGTDEPSLKKRKKRKKHEEGF